VSLCPTSTPLLPALKAIANTLDVRAFQMHPDAGLLWFLLRTLEMPPPAPFKWGLAYRQGDPDTYFFLGVCAADGSAFALDHEVLLQMRQAVDVRRLAQVDDGPTTPQKLFVAPDASRDAALGAMPSYELEEALAAEASFSGYRVSPLRVAGVDPPRESADVFRACMSGDVDEVRRFLAHGGYVDCVYKDSYGWDVGPDWRFTQPSKEITPLNYVATWTDVVGEPSAELVRLLLENSADPRRDDGQDAWYLPLHNAVANGAHDVVRVLLELHPDVVNLTTGEGQTSLHLLRLCDDATDRMVTLELLLAARAELDAQEPFEGNAPLHILAREGFVEVAARLLEAGASPNQTNNAGRTPLEEAHEELRRLEITSGPGSATRLAKLRETVDTLQLVVAALT